MNRENKTVSNVPTMEIEIQGNKATLCFAEKPSRRQQSESSRFYSMSSIKQICGAVKDKYTLHQKRQFLFKIQHSFSAVADGVFFPAGHFRKAFFPNIENWIISKTAAPCLGKTNVPFADTAALEPFPVRENTANRADKTGSSFFFGDTLHTF